MDGSAIRGQALKGHLDLMLLAILAGGPAHGYAIIQELRERSGGAFDLPEGTIYPALRRLERDSLVSSRWSNKSGRRRRLYTLTSRGRGTLRSRSREWRWFTQAVDGVLEGAS